MLDGVRRSAGCLVSRFRFRKSRDKVISFTRSLADAQSALLIMPLAKLQEPPPASLFALLRKHFREENMTFIIGQDGTASPGVPPRSQVLRLSDRDVSFLFLPRQEILQRIKRREYDVAIDLNLDFVLPSGYICRESNARVRLGFAGGHADAFYNLQIQADRNRNMPHTYERLTKCLQMFQAGDRP